MAGRRVSVKVLVRWSIQGETLVDTKSLEAAKDIVSEALDGGNGRHPALWSGMPAGLYVETKFDYPEILSAVIVDWTES